MKVCKRCGRLVEKISRHGLCEDCAREKMIEAIRQLRKREGPYYEKWLENLRKSLEKLEGVKDEE